MFGVWGHGIVKPSWSLQRWWKFSSAIQSHHVVQLPHQSVLEMEKKRGGQNPMVPSFSVICRDFSEYFEEDVQVYILRLEVTTVTCLIAVIQYNYSVFACFWDRRLLHLVLPSVDVLWPLTLDEIRWVASTQRFVSHKFSQLLRYDWNALFPWYELHSQELSKSTKTWDKLKN